MANSPRDPARTPKLDSDTAENSIERRHNLATALMVRAIARVDSLNEVLQAIACADQLTTVARQVRDTADPISSNDLNALFSVLHEESKRRFRIAEAAVAAMSNAPAAPEAS